MKNAQYKNVEIDSGGQISLGSTLKCLVYDNCFPSIWWYTETCFSMLNEQRSLNHLKCTASVVVRHTGIIILVKISTWNNRKWSLLFWVVTSANTLC